MAQVVTQEAIAGFEAPVHRALTEPILLAGAPRAVAILNGTISAAIGLGLVAVTGSLVALGVRTPPQRYPMKNAAAATTTITIPHLLSKMNLRISRAAHHEVRAPMPSHH